MVPSLSVGDFETLVSGWPAYNLQRTSFEAVFGAGGQHPRGRHAILADNKKTVRKPHAAIVVSTIVHGSHASAYIRLSSIVIRMSRVYTRWSSPSQQFRPIIRHGDTRTQNRESHSSPSLRPQEHRSAFCSSSTSSQGSVAGLGIDFWTNAGVRMLENPWNDGLP